MVFVLDGQKRGLNEGAFEILAPVPRRASVAESLSSLSSFSFSDEHLVKAPRPITCLDPRKLTVPATSEISANLTNGLFPCPHVMSEFPFTPRDERSSATVLGEEIHSPVDSHQGPFSDFLGPHFEDPDMAVLLGMKNCLRPQLSPLKLGTLKEQTCPMSLRSLGQSISMGILSPKSCSEINRVSSRARLSSAQHPAMDISGWASSDGKPAIVKMAFQNLPRFSGLNQKAASVKNLQEGFSNGQSQSAKEKWARRDPAAWLANSASRAARRQRSSKGEFAPGSLSRTTTDNSSSADSGTSTQSRSSSSVENGQPIASVTLRPLRLVASRSINFPNLRTFLPPDLARSITRNSLQSREEENVRIKVRQEPEGDRFCAMPATVSSDSSNTSTATEITSSSGGFSLSGRSANYASRSVANAVASWELISETARNLGNAFNRNAVPSAGHMPLPFATRTQMDQAFARLPSGSGGGTFRPFLGSESATDLSVPVSTSSTSPLALRRGIGQSVSLLDLATTLASKATSSPLQPSAALNSVPPRVTPSVLLGMKRPHQDDESEMKDDVNSKRPRVN